MTNKGIVTAALCLCATTMALAGPTVNVQTSPYQAGQGGEFDVTILAPGLPGLPAGSQFATFCLERNEYITLGKSYYGLVLTYSDLGGLGGGPHDPLDSRTAWLYGNFLSQTLPGYDFSTTSGRKASAEALQHAIWYVEQEETASEINALPEPLRTNTWSFINLANANNPGSIGLVRVLALYTDAQYTNRAQDVLCQVVPAPGALMLSGIGTLVVSFIRRRRLGKAN